MQSSPLQDDEVGVPGVKQLVLVYEHVLAWALIYQHHGCPDALLVHLLSSMVRTRFTPPPLRGKRSEPCKRIPANDFCVCFFCDCRRHRLSTPTRPSQRRTDCVCRLCTAAALHRFRQIPHTQPQPSGSSPGGASCCSVLMQQWACRCTRCWTLPCSTSTPSSNFTMYVLVFLYI